MRLFTDEKGDTWNGGYYELAIELGPRSEARLEKALLALWGNAGLDGCYVRRDLEPVDQQRAQPSLPLLKRYGHLLGVATLPGGGKVACGVCAVREEGSIDWLDLYLPMGTLSTVYDVGAFPFDDGKDSQMWREPLDRCLVELAQSVYAVTPFELALIGHEVSGRIYAAEIAVSGIPTERWDGYLWKEQGMLVWYPPTIYNAPIAIGR